MKINIYYGGRGLIEDPMLYILNKLTEVLKELLVDVTRYNLYEDKNGISMLPGTLKEADGIILAASVEWLGIGGMLQSFLDACWLYGDKGKIASIYMMPVVAATAYGEKDAHTHLQKAWELLGGTPVEGICAYIEDQFDFENNKNYALLIEKRAENLYRSISKKISIFPSSTMAVKENVFRNSAIDLTPQESEQLSIYVSNDDYVKKQKEDIEELTQMFQGLLDVDGGPDNYITKLEEHYHPLKGIAVSYSIQIAERGQALIIELNEENINCYYGEKADADIIAKTSAETFEQILDGKANFQSAFMAGELTAQGDFKILRSFDTLFQFEG